uniref:F-box domain-containing protein n=1 Tax=Macrostomum lignano TaxID=282301 RepID=A0A1I8J322_9PLAT
MDLRQLDPELRRYLRVTRLPEVYEALLAGLAIMQPINPCKWIAEKLFYLQEVGISQIDWDSFIDEEMKPKESPFAIKGVTGLFGGDMGQPSPEMISRAYQHYNRKSFRRHFDSWLQFHLYRRRRLVEKRRILAKADGHFFQTKVGQIFGTWLEWTRFRKGRQAMAYQILQRVLHVSVVRVMFKAWHGVSLEARKTREYFERLERGDNVTEDEVLSKSTGEARDDLSLVSESLRQQILRHLSLADMSRAACVCRAWKAHTQSSELLHKLDFGQVRQHLTPPVAKKFLAQSGPMLGHLSLAGCRDLPLEVFQCIGACRNLQDVNLSECASLTDDAVGQIVQGCPLLIYVNLSFTGISDNSLRLVAKHAENVRFLSLAGCQQLSDRGLQFLAQGQGVHKLELLDLSEGVQEVASHCPSVEHYELFGCSSLTDDSFRAISNRSLRVLKLDKNDIITDAAFGHLGRRCPELHQLCVADCVRVTDQALKAIGQLRYIRVLNLADCVRLSDAGAKSIAEASFAQSLRELNLTNAVRLTDHGVTAICKKAPGLTHLEAELLRESHTPVSGLSGQLLSGPDMSGTGMNDSAMSVLGSLSRMRYLYLANCPQVTDLGLQKLVQQLRYLEHLDLSHCVQLTDGGVRSMSFSCRLLTKLSLRGCRQLTDLSMQYVSGVCHYLTHLDLSECVMITDKSLKYLKKACKRLQNLQLDCCQGISKASVIRMTRRIPSVTHSTQDPLGPGP